MSENRASDFQECKAGKFDVGPVESIDDCVGGRGLRV